jgi:hypothetical protein
MNKADQLRLTQIHAMACIVCGRQPVPGLIVPVEWSAADIARGYIAFVALLNLWKARKAVA